MTLLLAIAMLNKPILSIDHGVMTAQEQKNNLGIRTGSSFEARMVAVYMFLLVFVSIFGRQVSVGLQQAIIWLSSPILVIWLLLPKFLDNSIVIPRPLLLYISLLIFALIGLPMIIDMDFFIRYFRVIALNFTLMLIVFSAIKNWEDVLVIFSGIGIACACVVVVSYFIDVSSAEAADEFHRLDGISGNSNGLASVARIGIFCCLLYIENNRKRIINVLLVGLIIFMGYSILLSASRGNFINLLILIGGYLYIKFFSGARVILLVLLMFFAGSILLTMFEQFLQGFFLYQRLQRAGDAGGKIVEEEKRAELYVTAFKVFTEHPFLGVGLGQFRFYNESGLISHTDILDILVQLGVFAGIAYVSIYVNIAKGLLRVKKRMDNILNNKSVALLILLLFCEMEYGIVATNWFDQTEMILVTLMAATASITVQKNLAVRTVRS